MNETEVKIKRLSEKATLPSYANPYDAGMDLYSVSNITISPGETCLIPTGIAIELPNGFEAQVRPRSGLARNYSVTVLNTPGTIDSGYRGEICVLLINHGKTDFTVTEGMKMAQMVVAPVYQVKLREVECLSDSTRSDKGFGSSGL